MALDPVLYMQVEVAHLYMKQHNITAQEFLVLDEKYGVLEFIGEAYEPFHLTGDQGILNEVREYIDFQR